MTRKEKQRVIDALKKSMPFIPMTQEEFTDYIRNINKAIDWLEKDPCLDFDVDKVKEILKRDDFDDLIVDHTCEKKQGQTRDEKIIDDINFAIKITDGQDKYSIGMRNGMRYVKNLIDGKEPQYESMQTDEDEEIKLGINIGDEVVSDLGAKGVVVGIDFYKGKVLLSLLMRNHKVPQTVEASVYKTKTGRHFPQIMEVLDQIKGETGKAESEDNE